MNCADKGALAAAADAGAQFPLENILFHGCNPNIR